MITLHQFEPALGLPNASPFCMKLETYLRMAGLPYQAPCASMRTLTGAPKGKLPYIEDRGQRIADSSFVIDYLKATYGDPLDAWLSAEQRATALAFQRLLEEHLYWAVVYTRWIDAAGWELTRPAFFGKMPPPLRWFVPPIARRGMRNELKGHGMGRHTATEIHHLAQKDITAIADLLADKPYVMGEAPCSLDACLYAFMANLVWVPLDSPLKLHALRYPNLSAYCERMRTQYFSPSGGA
jgi:glutathione S-transferase